MVKDEAKLEKARQADGDIPVKQSLFAELFGQIISRRKVGYWLSDEMRSGLYCCCKARKPPSLVMKEALYTKGMRKID